MIKKRSITLFFLFTILASVLISATIEEGQSSTESSQYNFFSALGLPCIDDDADGICNQLDYCPDTPKTLTVDKNGCSHYQFCRMQPICGPACDFADWKNNSQEANPKDCITVLINNEGEIFPRCVPLECEKVLKIPNSTLKPDS